MDWYPLWLSLQVATLATATAVSIGVPVAAALALRRFPGRDLADVLLTAPLVLPPTVLGYYLLVALGRQSPIGQWIEAFTGSPIVFTKTGAILAATIGAIPFVVRASRAAFESVDPQLVRAARTLGAGPLRALTSVQIPLAAPGLAAGAMLGFARALGDFGVTLMVAGNIPGHTQTASLAIYDALQAQRDTQARTLALVLAAVAVAILYSANRLTPRPHAQR
jgi:molybdate transport system permease protein